MSQFIYISQDDFNKFKGENMSSLFNISKLTIAILLALLLVTNYASASNNNSTIAGLVIKTNGFDVLEFALDAEGLLETLDGKQKFTLFAPTNDAFQLIADECTNGDINALASALISAGLLDDVLLYHVANYRISLKNLLSQGNIHTLAGSDVTSGVSNNGINVQGVINQTPSNFVSKGIRVRNGIVYPIDQILLNVDPTSLCVE